MESYKRSIAGNKTPISPVKTIIKKTNSRLTTMLSYHKMIYTPFHGKQNSDDTCWIFLLYTPTPMQAIFMENTPKEHILLLSCFSIVMTQAKVKIGKLALLLTHLQYNLQILHRMVRVKTLKPQQT